MTKARSRLRPVRRRPPLGSGVRAKSRFRRYSARGMGAPGPRSRVQGVFRRTLVPALLLGLLGGAVVPEPLLLLLDHGQIELVVDLHPAGRLDRADRGIVQE